MPLVAQASTRRAVAAVIRSSGVEHQAERVPGRVRVDAEVLRLRRIRKTMGAECQHLSFRLVDVVHFDVEVKLLRARRVGPVWRDVVWSQLHGETDIAALERRPVVGAMHDRDVEHR